MITVQELADRLRLSYAGALTLCHRDDFPARKFGNRFRVDDTKLDDWFHQKGEFLNLKKTKTSNRRNCR